MNFKLILFILSFVGGIFSALAFADPGLACDYTIIYNDGVQTASNGPLSEFKISERSPNPFSETALDSFNISIMDYSRSDSIWVTISRGENELKSFTFVDSFAREDTRVNSAVKIPLEWVEPQSGNKKAIEKKSAQLWISCAEDGEK